jgi:hypothetical protein
MMAAFSALLLEDAAALDVFTAEELDTIRQAHAAALPCFQYSGPAAFVHLDLHIFNIFAARREGRIEPGKLFDFGMCLYLPPYVLHYNEKAFDGQEAVLAREYGVSEAELRAFDLLNSLEFVTFLTSIRWKPDAPYGYKAKARDYAARCRAGG